VAAAPVTCSSHVVAIPVNTKSYEMWKLSQSADMDLWESSLSATNVPSQHVPWQAKCNCSKSQYGKLMPEPIFQNITSSIHSRSTTCWTALFSPIVEFYIICKGRTYFSRGYKGNKEGLGPIWRHYLPQESEKPMKNISDDSCFRSQRIILTYPKNKWPVS
jgi:hypothetical protein